jgi:hypothetical protein
LEDRKEDKRNKIREKYPLLFRNPIPFECDGGWLDLIDELSSKLEGVIKELFQKEPELKNQYDFSAIQVKEKFGELRFYMSAYVDEMFGLITEYTDKSKKICEVCGNEAALKEVNPRWYKTICDGCLEVRRSFNFGPGSDDD